MKGQRVTLFHSGIPRAQLGVQGLFTCVYAPGTVGSWLTVFTCAPGVSWTSSVPGLVLAHMHGVASEFRSRN